MSSVSSAPSVGRASTPEGYRHQAVVWHGTDDFVDRVMPFVRDAVTHGAPTMVVLPSALARPLRVALGEDASAVLWQDMAVLGRNPARLLAAWLDFLEEHRDSPVPLRAVHAPIWDGRTAAEVAECELHEALLNVAVPEDAPLWLLCPYDGALPADVLHEAHRSHPEIADPIAPARRAPYAGESHSWTLASRPLDEPSGDVTSLPFSSGGLSAVRALVRRHAGTAGLAPRPLEQLTLAVNELAANSIDHGGGSGVLRVWQDGAALVCEVADGGVMTDLLAGRVAPTPDQPRGRGLWLVNQLCDLTQVRVLERGTVVRVVTWV